MGRVRPLIVLLKARYFRVAGSRTVHLPAGHPGAGAEARNSIGLVLVGGMFIGTLFTLFVVPSIYMLIARDHGKDRERDAGVAAKDDRRPEQ